MYPTNITSNTWQMNVHIIESSLKRLKRSNHFQNFKMLIFILKIKKKVEQAMHTLFFEFFKKCVKMANVNALWKIFLFSKCVDTVPNSTHFQKEIQSAIFFKVRCNSAVRHTLYERVICLGVWFSLRVQ